MTRSKTPPDLPGRCPRCWVVEQHCICAELGRSENRTEIVFVRHHWEAHKSTGTARIAALVLEKSRIVELGYDTALCDAELATIDGAWLLYPGAPAAPSEAAPERLMVIDGTWAQSRRMLSRLPSLQRLRRYSLQVPPSAQPALRKSPHASGYSTIRAVAAALAELEGPGVGAPLEHASRLHIERVLLARHGPAWLSAQ
ncbi:MAG TPA: tRNA-uridine aminocarboxypropyltransferase [Polyangiaceae bacterium]|nr:tRNA-uridine aminocarboxypropyltransferase [Polyangiaceae bacterium]